MTKHRVFLAVSLLAVLLLAGCGLSDEPGIVQEISLPTPVPAVTVPQALPDLTAGAAFYAEHCASCHGVSGQGDGVMVADGRLSTPPPDFSDFAVMSAQTPVDYMKAITDGNILAGMPPFASYPEQDRWNVAAYVYTGAVTQEQLALGEQVYAANCASCHGGGTGNGPDAPEIMPDLTALDFWAENSSDLLFQKISTGVMPGMPAFGAELSEDEIRASVAYLRTFAMVGAPGFPDAGVQMADAASEPAATELASAEMPAEPTAAPVAEEVAPPETITVNGRVVNGTANGSIPEGSPVTLHLFDPPDYAETTIDGVIAADGSYVFSDVPHVADRVYLLSLQYQDVFFSSTVYQVENATGPNLDTTLQIFEMTDNPAILKYEAGVMRITFTHFGMEVGEVLSVTNSSDMLYLTDEELSGNQRVALRIPLPPGAAGVAFESGMQGTRFLLSDDESIIFDTQPVRPGREDIFFSYYIPYEDGAINEQELLYPFSGPFHLLIEAGQVQLQAQGFSVAGERVDMGGQSFDAYVATLDLAAGDVLSFTLSGTPDAVAALQDTKQPASGGLSPLVIALIVIGVVLIGAGGFLFLLRQDTGGIGSRETEINNLLEEIAALDDQHDRGEINHDVYQRTRARLKDELTDLMRDESGEG